MKRDYLLSMIKELVAIPSVTESAEESAPGAWLRARLEKLPYFAENPAHLITAETPLEGSPHALKSLVARVDAAKPTKRTVLMVSHYDVVDVTVYGDIAKHAFDTDKLGEIFGADEDTLYGRGVSHGHEVRRRARGGAYRRVRGGQDALRRQRRRGVRRR